MIRKLIRVVAVLIVLAVVLVIVIALSLDRLVKAGVEKGGTAVLGVPTELNSASVSVLGGTLELNGLVLGNLEGFQAPEMFRLGSMQVALDLWSLRGDEIVVHEIVVDGPQITLESTGGKTNWGVLAGGLKDEPSEEEREMKNIRIDRIVVRNGRIMLEGFPLVETSGIRLPDLEITGLSTADGKGMMVGQALAQVLASLSEKMTEALRETLPAEDLAELKEELESGVKAAAEELLEGVTRPKDILRGILGDGEGEGEE